MSIPVDLSELGTAAAEHDFAYLVSIAEDASAHVVAVRPVVGEGMLTVSDLGRRSLTNASARPRVTLVWPPRSPAGYSLISDGQASLGSVAGSITIVPTRAVLHRSAPTPTASVDMEVCGSDCVELPLQPERA